MIGKPKIGDVTSQAEHSQAEPGGTGPLFSGLEFASFLAADLGGKVPAVSF